jgi:hypothetical protein
VRFEVLRARLQRIHVFWDATFGGLASVSRKPSDIALRPIRFESSRWFQEVHSGVPKAHFLYTENVNTILIFLFAFFF